MEQLNYLDFYKELERSEMKLHFISVLEKLMKTKKVSQLALSKCLEIRQSQVSNWLNGKSLPSYESIQILCNYFQICADKFFA